MFTLNTFRGKMGGDKMVKDPVPILACKAPEAAAEQPEMRGPERP